MPLLWWCLSVNNHIQDLNRLRKLYLPNICQICDFPSSLLLLSSPRAPLFHPDDSSSFWLAFLLSLPLTIHSAVKINLRKKPDSISFLMQTFQCSPMVRRIHSKLPVLVCNSLYGLASPASFHSILFHSSWCWRVQDLITCPLPQKKSSHMPQSIVLYEGPGSLPLLLIMSGQYNRSMIGQLAVLQNVKTVKVPEIILWCRAREQTQLRART